MMWSGDMIKRYSHAQVRAIVISQCVRNSFESFHGSMDDGRVGFLSDDQMKMINICVRQSVSEALEKWDLALEKNNEAINWIDFQLSTFNERYMEPPYTPELDKSFNKFVLGYEGEKQ